MGETRVDLLHLLEDLRDAYPGAIEETIVTEIVANSLDSSASVIQLQTDQRAATFTVIDNGSGMRRAELARYHDIAATTKVRGHGIGFAGVGIKLGLLLSDEVLTETRQSRVHVASSWRMSSKRRAPWKWIPPPGLVEKRGTAVRLRLTNPLSALTDARFIAKTIRKHFEPLLDPYFTSILSPHYPHGIRFQVDGWEIDFRPWSVDDRQDLIIKLPRKRKPSALGFVARNTPNLPEDRRGIIVSTFGKVIKRGWDWLGITPVDPDSVGGWIEAPALAECLTLNKADFIRTGTRGATYLAYRKAIQEAVSNALSTWGVARDRREREQRRAARPVERDLENVLIDLADRFPLLSTLVERRTGGQRRLPIGVSGDDVSGDAFVAGPQVGHADRSETAGVETSEQAEPTQDPRDSPPAPPQAEIKQQAAPGPRRPTKYRLNIQFEERPDDKELARLVESTVWINASHPAYERAMASRAIGYHVALATGMALAPLAVEPHDEHAFITAFMERWGLEKMRSPRTSLAR